MEKKLKTKKGATMGDLLAFMMESYNEIAGMCIRENIGRNEIKNVTIDTCSRNIDGKKYETAIITDEDCYPCERYNNKKQAEIGHKKWCEKVRNAKNKKLKITYLRDGRILEDEEIQINLTN